MNKPGFFSPDNPAYPIRIVANVIFTTFLTVISAVATIIADTAIRGELALSNTESIWLTTLYLLGVNTTVPAAAWFAGHFGDKRMYTYGVLIFTFATLIVGLAPHFLLLAVGRFIEGVGAGLIFPTGLALIVQNTPKERLPLALNLYVGIAFGGGMGFGLPLSGYLAQFLSWRFIFLSLVPIGLILGYFCWLSRRKRPKREKVPFDYGGFFSFATFIASFLLALTLGPIDATAEGWRSWYIVGFLALAGISLILTLWIEHKVPYPLFPPALFKDPLFATGVIAVFILGMSIFASVSVSIDYMINALEYEKYVAGKIAMVYGFSMGLASVLANWLTKYLPIPFLTFTGLSFLVYSYFLNNELSWLTGIDQVQRILFLRGLGIGLSLGPTTALALRSVPPELKNAAATLLTFFRQVGGTYGGTLIAIFSIRQTIFHTARFGEQASDRLPGYYFTFQNLCHKFPDPARAKAAIVKNILTQAYIQGLNDALLVFGYVTGGVAFILLLLLSYRSWRQRSHFSRENKPDIS